MKRVGYIYEKIYDINNIKVAIWKSSEGKRNHRHVKEIIYDIDHYANEIREMLINKTFKPEIPKNREIFDGANKKERTIFKPKFYPDHVIHWALLLQLEPIIMKSMYEYNCGSVPGRGTTYGQKALRRWLDNDYRGTKWCLKLDVQKFYPSIDNEILKAMFRRKIKDQDCLWLIDSIIDSTDGQPIGYYTSQWFSNFFLEGLDHFIKGKLRIKYYIRYVDDLILLDSNKRKLHRARKEIENYLRNIKLNLKDNWQVFNVNKRAIDFLGLRFFRDKTILRKRNALRIRRRVNKIAKKGYLNEKDARAIISYWGWIRRSDSYLFYHKYVKPVVSINLAKKVVSINDRNKIRQNNKRRDFVAKLHANRRIQRGSVRRHTGNIQRIDGIHHTKRTD